MLLVLVLRHKVLEKYQVHSSTDKYIVSNQKLYTINRFFVLILLDKYVH